MQGMQRMDTALRRLLDAKMITGDDAYLKARNKDEFKRFREDVEEVRVTEDTSPDTGKTPPDNPSASPPAGQGKSLL